MLNRRRPLRTLLAGLALAGAVIGLAGCRSDPGVAAYVGGDTVSVDRLQGAVAAHRDADPAIATYAQAHTVAFTRQVLSLMVTQQIYQQAAQRYGVQVSDATVQQRISDLLAGNDPASVYGQLAQRGISRQDVVENIRQQIIRQRIAAAKGLAGPLSEAALQARYQQVKSSLAQKAFGYITVADQATADAVLAQLTADPSRYPQLAQAHAGPYTLATMQPGSPGQLPQAMSQGISAAAPNTGFTVPLPQAGGVVVVFVGNVSYPSYQDVRPQLVQEAETAVGQQAAKLVDRVRQNLHIRVNPRYGVLNNGSIQPATGGVVDILGSGGATGTGASGSGSGSGTGSGSGAAGG